MIPDFSLCFTIFQFFENIFNQEEMMNELLRKFQELGIVPVVVLDNAKDAEPLAKALCDGGLPCAEVTFRTDAAICW